jgi:hypothetical protein
MLKFPHEFFRSGDAHLSVPTFDFYFKVVIPKKQKEREIVERDSLGRIVHSRTPETT